jgi:hypothetical protein
VSAINILSDGPRGPHGGRFVEVETDDGKSVRDGEWVKRPDGLWALRITDLPQGESQHRPPEG